MATRVRAGGGRHAPRRGEFDEALGLARKDARAVGGDAALPAPMPPATTAHREPRDRVPAAHSATRRAATPRARAPRCRADPAPLRRRPQARALREGRMIREEEAAAEDSNARDDSGAFESAIPGEVSVVVPAFNEEQSIVRLLEALAGQTLRPAEIVVADGGSTDRTRALVREFGARSTVPVVLVESGRGLPGRNRNLAIARASREWVACVDAGTVPRRDWLERLVEAARREPRA